MHQSTPHCIEIAEEAIQMKNVLYFILALVVASIAWGIIHTLLAHILGFAFRIGMFVLFCGFVMFVFRSFTRQKI